MADCRNSRLPLFLRRAFRVCCRERCGISWVVDLTGFSQPEETLSTLTRRFSDFENSLNWLVMTFCGCCATEVFRKNFVPSYFILFLADHSSYFMESKVSFPYTQKPVGRDIVVSIETGYWLDGPAIESWLGGEIFRTRPDWPWSPPNLLYTVYWSFLGEKRPGRGVHPPPTCST